MDISPIGTLTIKVPDNTRERFLTKKEVQLLLNESLKVNEQLWIFVR